MPRKSLVINGFLGGINQDGEPTDLESEDRQGKNELVTCEDALCNQPGQIRAKRPTIKYGTSDGDAKDGGNTHDITLSGTAGETDDFLIYGDLYYRNKGIYKLGEDIEFSRDGSTAGSTVINKPLKGAFGSNSSPSNIKTTSIGLDAYGGADETNTNFLFQGKLASTNGSGNCLIGDLNTLGDSVTPPKGMIRWGVDVDDDERLEEDFFDEFLRLGAFDDRVGGSDWTVALWDDSATQSATTPIGSPLHTNGSEDNTIDVDTAGSGYASGGSATYTAVPLTGGNGTGAKATIVVSSGAVASVTVTTGGDEYRIGDDLSASNANLGGAGTGLEATVDLTNLLMPPGYSTVLNAAGAGAGAMVQAGFATAAGAADISETDYIRIGRNDTVGDTNNDVGLIFRVGNSEFTSDTDEPDGIYGTSFNVTDKDIYVEIEFNGEAATGTGDEGAGAFWNGFDVLNITLDCQKDDLDIHYSDSNFDSYGKTYEITKSELVNNGCLTTDGSTAAASGVGGRFKIPYDSAIHTGTNFSPTDIKNVAIVLVGGNMDAPNHTDPKTIWCCRLYELSFAASDTIGWANTSTLFSQTQIKESSTGNKVESLLQPYESVLTLTSESVMRMKIYEPNDTTYDGKVYYQEADDNGNGIGSLFLLADVSKSKGVKSILSEFYEPWSELALSSVTWASSGPTVTHAANSAVRVGMRLTGDSDIPANSYVAAVLSDTTFNLNTNPTGTESGGVALTLSGTVEVNISDPAVSTTYQLSSGYDQDTETINAIWDHSAVVGRQIYIGSVIKTGDDLPTELSALASGSGTRPSMYPLIDTTGYTRTDDEVKYLFKITDLDTTNPDKFKWRREIPAGTQSQDYGSEITITAESYMAAFEDGLKLYWPVDTGFTVNDIFSITIKKEKDLILKSAIGKRYGFPNLQYVDLELPGTGITAMYSAGDRLFCFTATSLIVVNVAQDYEYLEGTFQGHGVASPKQVVEVNEGIAFVNNSGVYYFDGNSMKSLSDDLMMTFGDSGEGWGAATNIGYLAEEKLICVWYDDDFSTSPAADTIIAYSLATKAWVCVSKTAPGPNTRIKFYNNKPYWLVNGSPDVLYKLSILDTTTDTIKIETGKISCGDLSRLKRFIKLYITIANGNEFEVTYTIDGTETGPIDLTNGTSEIDIGKKGKTIQLKIESDTTVDASTSISDITLVYRDLRVD